MQTDTRKALIHLALLVLPVILVLSLALWVLCANPAQTLEGGRTAGLDSMRPGYSAGTDSDRGKEPPIVITSADDPDAFISALTAG